MRKPRPFRTVYRRTGTSWRWFILSRWDDSVVASGICLGIAEARQRVKAEHARLLEASAATTSLPRGKESGGGFSSEARSEARAYPQRSVSAERQSIGAKSPPESYRVGEFVGAETLGISAARQAVKQAHAELLAINTHPRSRRQIEPATLNLQH